MILSDSVSPSAEPTSLHSRATSKIAAPRPPELQNRRLVSLNTLAYASLGEAALDPIVPEDYDADNSATGEIQSRIAYCYLMDLLDHRPSFLEWLEIQAAGGSEVEQAGSSTVDPIMVEARSRIARQAQDLLALANLTHTARLRAHQIETARCITGGLLQTPIISRAIRAQDRNLHLVSHRRAFIEGAGYAGTSQFGAIELEELGIGNGEEDKEGRE